MQKIKSLSIKAWITLEDLPQGRIDNTGITQRSSRHSYSLPQRRFFNKQKTKAAHNRLPTRRNWKDSTKNTARTEELVTKKRGIKATASPLKPIDCNKSKTPAL